MTIPFVYISRSFKVKGFFRNFFGPGLYGRDIERYKAYMKHYFIFPKFQALPNPFSVKRKDVLRSNSKTIRDRNMIFGMIVDLYNV